ncbi:hypothetical protein [Arthrobacter sp. FW306-04-A]|uniref:hypothetical protein n=1 Tax=Arthrobacter sp. FW306-04-A TaxID=2879619 RepID=UPI0037BE4CD5|nr:hypothetical protein LFT43_12355 [Arthrobacter sp. FW306-04-A]
MKMTTMEQLIAREKEQLAAKRARREALHDALSELGRMKSDGVERSIPVRTNLNIVDADIARSEAKIRELEAEKAHDEALDVLADSGLLVFPGSDSPDLPAYRERLAVANARREAIEGGYVS